MKMRMVQRKKHKLFKSCCYIIIMEDMITIPREEYEVLKNCSDIDLLMQLIKSFKDIKDNEVRRVK